MADQFKKLRIFICTWNVAEIEPIPNDELARLVQIKENQGVDIFAVGLQEIKTGAKETVQSFIDFDEWSKSMRDLFSEHQYYMVESVRVQGISLSVFAKIEHLPYIRFISTEIERTGIARAWGNKGGVAVSCWLYGHKVCFLNVHLSAHLKNIKERIEDVDEIFGEMGFNGKATVLSHEALNIDQMEKDIVVHLVFFFGDTNFRIDDLSREHVIESVAKKNYSVLWEKDQLKTNQKTHKALGEFMEEPLNFDPTYKYDPGTNTYDTSEKARKPAWTDRILWRIHPEVKELKSGQTFHLNVVKDSFNCDNSFMVSDHKPVRCQFDFSALNGNMHEPVVRIEINGPWFVGRKGVFKVESFEGMEWSAKDYVALYKGNLKDCRSYESWKFVPEFGDSSSSSSSSSDDDSKAVKATKQINDNVMYLAFNSLQLNGPGNYRIGYYSFNMSCLVALSDVVEVRSL